jgi:hypothetical protein
MVFPEFLQRQYVSSGADIRARVMGDRELDVHAWGCYNSKLPQYDKLFTPILFPDTSIADIATRIKSKKQTFVGMDLCGQGDILTTLGVTKGISVCLAHDYTRCAPPSDILTKLDGNLMLNDTWHTIDQWTKNNGNPDLIICAPGGLADRMWDWGRSHYFTNEHQYAPASIFLLLQKMISMLSSDGALLLDFQHSLIYRFLRNKKIYDHIPGDLAFKVNTNYKVLKISRMPKSENPTIYTTKFLWMV